MPKKIPFRRSEIFLKKQTHVPSTTFMIAGGSYAAINAIKILAQSIIPRALESNPLFRATIIVITPNTESYWNIASPRLLVQPELLASNKDNLFYNLESTLRQFIPIQSPHTLHILQGKVIHINGASNVVTYMKVHNIPDADTSFAAHTVLYDYLVLATGSSSSSPAFKSNGSSEQTITEIKNLAQQIKEASSVCIVGAGAVGVELAGELGFKYGDTKKITLYSGVGGTKEYGKLRSSKSAVTKLNALGVQTVLNVRAVSACLKQTNVVKYNVEARPVSTGASILERSRPKALSASHQNDRKEHKHFNKKTDKLNETIHTTSQTPTLQETQCSRSTTFSKSSITSKDTALTSESIHCSPEKPELSVLKKTQTLVTFNNGYREAFDCCILTTGNVPNSSYLPFEALDDRGYVHTDPYLRMNHGNPHGNIYVYGDLVAGSKQTLLDTIDQGSVLKATLKHDILNTKKSSLKPYKPGPATYIVPISPKGGLGVIFGIPVPALVVSMFKGSSFMIEKSGQYL